MLCSTCFIRLSILNFYIPCRLTRSQLLEGLKEESQIEDIRKREGVRARSLTRSTRGVEGRVGAPGLDYEEGQATWLFGPASKTNHNVVRTHSAHS